ncbi:MAG: hypothetical protein HFF06_06280 [Oscillospiraceae bacterium]|nr:hypothetical protein [Oscillospiraceae bacterium]
MVEIFDFSQWQRPEGVSEGSGASEKIWLQSPDGDKTGLFKFPKTRNYPGKPETTSTEHVSEWLASQLGKIFGVPCADVKLGSYHGRKGSLSVLITDNKEEHLELNEGVAFIKELYPQYDAKEMINKANGIYYCLDQILLATKEYLPTQFWIEVLLFDFMIGNTDRHQNNWALLKEESGQYRQCPLYDNGSSLCSYVEEEQLERLFSKDAGPMKSLTDTKSRSRIRIDGTKKKEPTHKEVIRYILDTYPRSAIPTARNFLERLTQNEIDRLLNELPEEIFPENRKMLVSYYLNEKKHILSQLLRKE